MEIGHQGTCEVGINSTVESIPFRQPLPQSQQQQCQDAIFPPSSGPISVWQNLGSLNLFLLFVWLWAMWLGFDIKRKGGGLWNRSFLGCCLVDSPEQRHPGVVLV